MVFFLDADEKVYGRYGGRDGTGPDARQSLDGLRYTMNSVLEMHGRKDKAYAPREKGPAKYTRDLPRVARRGDCLHCHQVREALNAELRKAGKWERDLVWRYPLPDNLGLTLELHRGNVVKGVAPSSPAAKAGLKAGDVLRLLHGVPLHSLADAQFALDRAPGAGKVALTWGRGGKEHKGALALPAGWRKSDVSWRPSLRDLVPSLPLYGADLTAKEKAALGLSAKQLAFRQGDPVPARLHAAGFRAGDVVVGVDGKKLEGVGVDGFRDWVGREYLVG